MNNHQYGMRPPYPPQPPMHPPPPHLQYPPSQSQYPYQAHRQYTPRPPRACFNCGDPGHLRNACPFNIPRRQSSDHSSNPSQPSQATAPNAPSVPASHVSLDMDSAAEADLVRAYAERTKLKKRPMNVEDFKSFASELATELRTAILHQPKEHQAATSPAKTANSAIGTPHRKRPRRMPPIIEPQDNISAASRGGSISSQAAGPKMRSIFEKQFSALSVTAIKKQLDDNGIEWCANDFRTLTKKATKIAELAACLADNAIADLKHASM